MTSMDLKIGIVLLVQIIIGILGNFSLLYHISLYFNGGRSRCTYMIFKHLTIANTLVIISRGIPETMVAFGLKHFLNGFGCKVVFYVHRVARGVSIGITCLLSVFQAITISPRNSRWAKLKVKALKYIGPSSILCWILNMLANIIVLTRETEKWSNKNITTTIDFKYCSATLCDKGTALLNAVLVSTPDVLCLGLMTWASVSIVFLLCRHKQRVQHIYRNNISPRFSSETRATQIILVLVSIFVCFYTFSSIIYIYFSFSGKSTRWLVNTSALINSCFPTASLFILLSCNPSVSRHFCACTRRNILLPHLIRKI